MDTLLIYIRPGSVCFFCVKIGQLVSAATAATTPAAREATTTTTSQEAATATASGGTATAAASQEATTHAATASAATAATGAAASTLLLRGLGTHLLGLGQESLQRQQLVRGDEELVALLERLGLDAFRGLDGEEHLVQGTEDLVDLTHLGLVFKVDRSVEVRDLDVDQATDDVAFASVHERPHFEHLVGGTDGGKRSAATPSSKAASASVHGG